MFNGTSTNALKTNRQGILYTARLDVNPLDNGFSETSSGPDLLVGLGAGAIHNPYTAYDEAGATVSVTIPTVSVDASSTASTWWQSSSADNNWTACPHVQSGDQAGTVGRLAPTDGTRANVPDGHRNHR